jgi:hypothetical protein
LGEAITRATQASKHVRQQGATAGSLPFSVRTRDRGAPMTLAEWMLIALTAIMLGLSVLLMGAP